MRTQEEIKKAIEKLKKNKEECVPRSAWGDDNKAKLDAQIEVLENNYNEEDIDENFESESPEWDAADAIYWGWFMEDDADIDGFLYPTLDEN